MGMNPIQFLKRRFGAILLLGVVGYCVVYAVAFVRLYSMEHPYKVASQWIFENLPAGSKIAGPHWDDKVPVGIPGKDTAIYQMNGKDSELPVYEKDTPQMIEMIVKRVAAADYLTFATPRAPDSIPRIPDEYPNTAALLRLLWGEKIGFTLAHTTKNRPSFLGFTFNDDLADESFSVYDHPKVAVFKNEQRLSAEQILERIRTVERYEPLPSMDEMLLMDTGGWQPSARLWDPAWSNYAAAVVLALILGGSVWVLLGRVFKALPDGGLGLSGLFGVVGAAALAWACGALRVVPLTRAGGCFVVALLVVLAAVKCMLRESTQRRVSEKLRRHGLGALISVLIGAVVVLIMRTSDSALSGLGEQVDAAYLSYLMRNQESMPWDLLKPGQRLSIAFADRFALGWLLKTAGIPAQVALSASFIVLGGLCAGALYSLLVAIIGRVRPAIVGVVIAIIPVVYLLHVARDVMNKPFVAEWTGIKTVDTAELAQWVRQRVPATPMLVEACDQGEPLNISAALGLPRFDESAMVEGGEDGEGALCGLEDPDQAYRRMMQLRLEFFVTPIGSSATDAAARGRYERFLGRPDLFARVFEDQHVALFVPSFSRYYPRTVPS